MRRQRTGATLALVAGAVVFLLLAAACQENKGAVNGPDGKPLVGGPGGAPFANPRNLKKTPLSRWLQLTDCVLKDMKKQADKDDGQVECPDPDGGAPVVVRWKRKPTPSFTLPDGSGLKLVSDADGIYSVSLVGLTPAQQHFGPSSVFLGHAAGCQDAVWIQYIKVEYTFYKTDGTTVSTKTNGFRIDQQAPYQNQEGVGTDGSAMQDEPGIVAGPGVARKDTAGRAVDRFRTEAGVAEPAVTKAKVVYSFWTYFVCLKPEFKILGHYEWGFTLVADKEHDPFMSDPSDVQPAKWTPDK